MKQRYFRFSTMLACLLSVFLSMSAYADAKLIVRLSPPGPDRERFLPPSGYGECHIVPSGYKNGIWVNHHRVCYYPNRSKWVSGYWQCLHMKRHNICTRWEWVPSHWERRRMTSYGPPSAPMIAPPAPGIKVVIGSNDHGRKHHGYEHH